MTNVRRPERLFVLAAFLIQGALLVFFALRKWNFPAAMEVGWIIYALALPALAVSIVLIASGKPRSLWIAGILYAAWAIFGYIVDLVLHVEWRSPPLWAVFIPYVLLYLSSMMFYWWPLGRIERPLWFAYAGLFLLSTYFNVSSHGQVLR